MFRAHSIWFPYQSVVFVLEMRCQCFCNLSTVSGLEHIISQSSVSRMVDTLWQYSVWWISPLQLMPGSFRNKKFVEVTLLGWSQTRRHSLDETLCIVRMVRIQQTLKSDCLIWLMLQRMMVGKNTSERGAVVVSMEVTTVLLVKSLAAM